MAIGLYQLIGGSKNGAVTSKTIEGFLAKNPDIDTETYSRLLAWRDEFRFWEKNAELLPYGEQGLPYRDIMKTIRRFADPGPGQIWLDAGCGAAKMSELIWESSGKRLARIIGLDIVFPELAKEREREIPVLELRYGNLGEKLEFNDGTFDGIISGAAISFVIEFEGNRGKAGIQKLFCEFARVLKPGGKLVWSTPAQNIHRIVCPIVSIPDMIRNPKLIKIAPDFLNYIKEIRRKGEEDIYTYLSPDEWDEMLNEAGFVRSTWQSVFTYQALVNKSLRSY
jgi:ubiquinone/menaquinone biosynthesis C-methylase UbiE